MKEELSRLILDYPNSDMVDLAQRILGESDESKKLLGDSIQKKEDEAVKSMDYSMYKYNPSATHFYALIVDGTTVNVYGTKVRITDFNTKNYSVEDLKVNSVLLDNNRHLVTVNSFKELSKALRFYNGLKDDTYVFSGFQPGTYDQFIISAENYPVFFQEKNTEAYKAFFEKNYLNK